MKIVLVLILKKNDQYIEIPCQVRLQVGLTNVGIRKIVTDKIIFSTSNVSRMLNLMIDI